MMIEQELKYGKDIIFYRMNIGMFKVWYEY